MYSLTPPNLSTRSVSHLSESSKGRPMLTVVNPAVTKIGRHLILSALPLGFFHICPSSSNTMMYVDPLSNTPGFNHREDACRSRNRSLAR